ncbi:MAG: alanine racemase [Elusimicrobiota bacterium]|nr:alanine racemase [Elusimicrobiota bacterium]
MKKSNCFCYRQNTVEVNVDDFASNFKTIRKMLSKNTKIMPILKNNAYGHGALVLAQEAEKLKVTYIGVACIEEGIQLRQGGIGTSTDILVLGNCFSAAIFEVAAKNSLTLSIYSADTFKSLKNILKYSSKKISFHLKAELGMGRIGVDKNSAYEILREIANDSRLNMTGMFTHFPVADTDAVSTRNQLNEFMEIVNFARKKLNLRFLAHCANSAAILKYKETHLDMVRPGIALYGILPFSDAEKTLKLKPALSWKTRIIQLKKVYSGISVSYGKVWVARKNSLIATISVGYGDGYSRSLSNKAKVLVSGKHCPIVGTITMDMSMVDVSDVKDVAVGDEVVLIGKQGNNMITAQELAKIQETISYEIVCSISSRVPRNFV